MSTATTEEPTTTTDEEKREQPIFRDINPDDPDPETTEIESACMSCFRTGSTRLLLTKIPFFKEVVLMSFKCDHCGYENNEIQSASEIQRQGVRIVLEVKSAADMNRRVVRSDHTAVSIPEVELEIPVQSQKGEITTVEGILDRTVRGLTQDQDKRRVEHPETAAAIDAYIKRLIELKELQRPFSVVLEDISGNSFVENPQAPQADANCKTTHFARTKDQDQLLGLYTPADIPTEEDEDQNDQTEPEAQEKHLLKPIAEGAWTLEELHGEVLQFQTLCGECHSPCETNMKMTSIPHFKEVVIMATVCDVCGWKTNEVKSGGGIEPQGMRFEVRVVDREDLSRDVLKSDTCSLRIPELDCEVGPTALGGRFTTVEGILMAMKEQLEGSGVVFHDSSDTASKQRINAFIERFERLLTLESPFTLVLDDPAGNSYVQSLSDEEDNEGADAKLKVEKYERSFEQNEELGLNDIKTEDYQQ